VLRRHDPELRERAGDDARSRAYIAAFRELPSLDPEAGVGGWLAGHVDRAAAASDPPEPVADFWERLAERLQAESPALAEPALPERRFPVIPRLQRRRR
jgi:hypothetical protein